ncbi:ATP-binding protein [Modestobacter sp. I12A-02662]|uniref:ATP-binding protein n=1 Tax=Modestobacter sp. I12A-02662 TaxID=1730496 RepID=UPI0034DE1DDB
MELHTVRPIGLFDGTGDDLLATLLEVGTEVPFRPGEVLFRENHPAEHWWVLLDGSVDLLRHVGRDETQLGVMDVPGRWAGGFRAWDEHGAYLATGRAVTAGCMLRVSADDLRRLWTTRFPLGLHLIEGVSRSARNYESMARQREALAALGTLAAGLAHELNNPAAAATRAVDALGEAYAGLLSSLQQLVALPISAEQFGRIDALRQELVPRPSSVDPMDLADREDALADWLSARSVRQDWVLAPVLAAAGADVDWCERVAEAGGAAALEAALDWVANTLSATGLLEEVKESARRISDLVAAVKSYSQLDRASMQTTDLVEGLESTLVVLAHRIPDDVVVVRDYGADVPRISALAAELNQVWTNLITNALDAMDGRGTLRLSTRLGRGAVVVEVADTGSGMSAETRQHAFDPFYTTKGVGEGTGLGLDISRRIVDRHRGDISIETGPGATVLRVRLPLAVPGGSAQPADPAR